VIIKIIKNNETITIDSGEIKSVEVCSEHSRLNLVVDLYARYTAEGKVEISEP